MNTETTTAGAKPAHTPGPWQLHPSYKHDRPCRVDPDNGGWEFQDMPISSGTKIIARASYIEDKGQDTGWPSVTDRDEMLANARLIAAAPKMLAALKFQHAVHHALGGASDDEKREAMRRVSDAIDSAEGREL